MIIIITYIMLTRVVYPCNNTVHATITCYSIAWVGTFCKGGKELLYMSNRSTHV